MNDPQYCVTCDDYIGSGPCHSCRERAGFVPCDDGCLAIQVPLSLNEYRLAYIHYRYHNYLGGCSHGR